MLVICAFSYNQQIITINLSFCLFKKDEKTKTRPY